MSISSSSSESNTLIAGCPQCNAPLNASFSVHLSRITIESDGTIKSYEGGPMPEGESDVLELANESDATIICERGHVYAIDLFAGTSKGSTKLDADTDTLDIKYHASAYDQHDESKQK